MPHTWARIAFASALVCSLSGAAFGSSPSFSKTFLSKTYFGVQHADLNNDGREDFVYTNGTGGFNVQLSTGDGVYAAAVSYTIPGGADAQLIGIADFNRDGHADLAIFGSDNSLHLFLNNGHGAFSQKSTYSNSKFVGVVSLVVADFNRDGAMDLAVEAASGAVIVFGNGKGGFTMGPSTRLENDGPLMVGDFDGDGNIDIANADIDNYDTADIYYGNGKGSFPARVAIMPTGNHFSFSAGDLDGDGKTDIIATQFYTSVRTIAVFYGAASRKWIRSSTLPLAHCAGEDATVADVNGDGVNDLILTEADCNNNSQQGNAYVGVITGKGNFAYNTDQIVFTGRFFLDSLSSIRATRNTKPGITFENCTTINECAIYGHTNQAILLNTTSGNFPSCPPPNAFEGVNVCSPAAGSNVTSPVSFNVGAAGQVPMRDVEVWVDGKKVAEQLDGFSNYTFLNRSVALSAGTHAVAIDAAGWDQSVQKKTFTFNVK
jgi:VCBS repeat protein/Big-like domain-containing protein